MGEVYCECEGYFLAAVAIKGFKGGRTYNLMFKSLAYSFVFLAFMVACSSSLPSATVVETKQPAFTNTPTIEVLVAITPTPTLSEPPIKNNILELTLEKICPPIPEVPFSDLGMPDTLALLTVPDEVFFGILEFPLSTDVLSYSGISDIPEKLTAIRKEGEDGIIGLSLSPSGKWMEITRWNNENQKRSLWVSTVDGQTQWKVKDLSRYQSTFWVKDNEILVTGSPLESEYEGGVPVEDRIPLFTINPFSLETRDLEPLPYKTFIFDSFNIIDGHPYAFYWDETYTDVYLFDYDAAKSKRVFQWIDFANQKTGIEVKDNGLYDVAAEKEGVDFATDLSLRQISEITDYADVMKSLYIDGQKLIADTFANRGKYYYITLPETEIAPDTNTFYLYDYKANVIKDYCLQIENVSGYIHVSPDEKFAHFTVDEGSDNSHNHIIVLNLETGNYSVIPNSSPIGFWQKE